MSINHDISPLRVPGAGQSLSWGCTHWFWYLPARDTSAHHLLAPHGGSIREKNPDLRLQRKGGGRGRRGRKERGDPSAGLGATLVITPWWTLAALQPSPSGSLSVGVFRVLQGPVLVWGMNAGSPFSAPMSRAVDLTQNQPETFLESLCYVKGRRGHPGSLGIHLAGLGAWVAFESLSAHDHLRGFWVLFSLRHAGQGEGSGLFREGSQGLGKEPVSMNSCAERSPAPGAYVGGWGAGGQTGTAVSAPPLEPPGSPPHLEGPFLGFGWGHWNLRCGRVFNSRTLGHLMSTQGKIQTDLQSSGDKLNWLVNWLPLNQCRAALGSLPQKSPHSGGWEGHCQQQDPTLSWSSPSGDRTGTRQ